MTDNEYQQLIEKTLFAIEDAIENSGAEIDYETNQGILTLQFSNRTKIIINPQPAVKQLWVAAKAGGFHLDYFATNQHWLTDNAQGEELKGEELFSLLSRLCTEQANEPIILT